MENMRSSREKRIENRISPPSMIRHQNRQARRQRLAASPPRVNTLIAHPPSNFEIMAAAAHFALTLRGMARHGENARQTLARDVRAQKQSACEQFLLMLCFENRRRCRCAEGVRPRLFPIRRVTVLSSFETAAYCPVSILAHSLKIAIAPHYRYSRLYIGCAGAFAFRLPRGHAAASCVSVPTLRTDSLFLRRCAQAMQALLSGLSQLPGTIFLSP